MKPVLLMLFEMFLNLPQELLRGTSLKIKLAYCYEKFLFMVKLSRKWGHASCTRISIKTHRGLITRFKGYLNILNIKEGTVIHQIVTIKLRQYKSTPAQQIPRQEKKSGNVPAHESNVCYLLVMHCAISVGAGGLMVWASVLHAEGRRFDSCAGTFPDFFCPGICCAGIDLCYLSLIVTFWVG